MKRITQIFLLLVCSFISTSAFAQMADISQYDDILYCEKVKVIAGNQTYLPIVLKNNMSMRGFQFDIYLPEGCTFSLDENSSPLILPSTRLLENDMNLSSSTVRNDGSIRVICHSSIGNSLSGACGEVVRIGISVTSTMLPGDYQIVLKNIHFSDDSSHDYSIFDQPTSILEVKEIPPADDSSIIVFADQAVKNICVDNWDLNLDGELSENEAAAVSSIGQIFRNNKDIVSFEELKYFTGMTIVESFAFDGCDNLVSISLPSSISEVWSLNTPKIQDVYIYCQKVPRFGVHNLSNIHLHVPFGTIDRYKNYYLADWWVFASIDHIVYNLCYYIDGVLHDEKKVAYEEPISSEYPSKEGYSFSGWSDLPLIMPFHDVEVTGFFTINQYEVAFVAGGEVIKKESLDFGSTITPPEDPAMTGYTFTGWNPVPDATVPAHDVTYTAQFRANQYTMTFDTDGGSEVAPITQDYNSAVNTPENPTKTGYTFAGWDREMPSTMPAENITIKALWTINQYTITFDTDGGSEIAPITQDYNSAVTAPADPTKTGYTFAGWDKEIPATIPAEDITIKALWTINQYTITFDTDGGSEIAPITQDYNSVVTAPADPTKTGYTFAGWDKEIPATIPAEDITIKALWTINQYTITFDTDGGSEIAPITQDYNTAVTIPTHPVKTGYTFAGWDREIPSTMPAGNITIKALWTINKYMLTYKVDGEVYKQYEIEYNVAITPEIAPVKEGYSFSGWDEIPATMPAKDIEINGTFSVNKYLLTYKVDGEIYHQDSVAFGTAIVLIDEPVQEGKIFSGWKGAPETMPAHDVTIVGSFNSNVYTLTYKVDGEVYKSVQYEFGENIIPEAAPTKEGHTFSGWSAIPETMPSHDVEIIGSFSINQYKVTFVVDGEIIKQETLDFGSVITAPADPTKTCYTFAGWDPTFEEGATVPVDGITYTAQWTINQYTITFDTDGGSEIAPITQDYNTAVTIPTHPVKTGYTFAGWDREIPSTMPAGNITIKALWTINKYMLTYKVDGEVYKQYEIEYNVAITPEIAPVKEGYSFSGWDEIPATMPANDVEVTGTLTINKYKVTFIVDGETVKEETLDFGSLISVPDDPTKIGHTFTGWNPAVDATVPSHDVTYEAKFSVNQYTITFDTDGGSEIAPITQDYNTAVTIPTHPVKEGYTFAGWDKEIPSTMPAENITIKALWTINQYKVTFLADGIVISEETLDYGSPVTVPEAPDKEGYTFVNWGEVDEKVPAHDVVYVANYEVNYYKLTYILDDVVYGEFDVAFGETIIPLEVDPVEGRLFEGWQDMPVTMPSHDVKVYGTTVLTNISVMATEGSHLDVYTLGGILVKKNVDMTTLRSTLDPGIYIINGKKVKL